MVFFIEERDRLYECSECKRHYLALSGLLEHVRYRHSQVGENVQYKKVPLGAGEFD